MQKRKTTLAFWLMVVICLFPLIGQVDAAASSAESEVYDPEVFADAVLIEQCNRDYDWTIVNKLWDDQGMPIGQFQDKYYMFIPTKSMVYPIISRPGAFHDTYLVLFTADATGGIVELTMPAREIEQEDGVWDYIIDAELTAGQTYYIKVASISGGDGTVMVRDGESAQQTGGTPEPQAVSLTTKVGEAGYSVGGETKAMAACYYKGSDAMMPIRMLQDLGVSFAWDAATQTATMTRDENTVKLIIGSTEAVINGVKTPIIGASGKPMAPELAPGRTMIPLRFVSQHLGFGVKWEPSHLITISR